jgi:hypothetical protein
MQAGASEDNAKHWHYAGGGFIAVGCAVAGIDALAVYTTTYTPQAPRPDILTTGYAIFAYVCFFMAVACGVGAARGWQLSFRPVLAVAREIRRWIRRLRATLALMKWQWPILVKVRVRSPIVRRHKWTVVEGSEVPLLEILRAVYGPRDRTDPVDGEDALESLRSKVLDGQLHFKVGNDTLFDGRDPYPDQWKSLWIEYRVGGESAQSVIIEEYSDVDLP